MRKIFFFLFLTTILASSKTFAKATICEITFFSNAVKHDCLMVLNDSFSYGNNYMRVAYTVNGNYIVINQKLSIERQLLADGNTYITATGYNVRFVTNTYGHTYNPDKLSVLINAAGVIDQPKIGDSNNAMMPVASFRDVSNTTLEYNYLKRFFLDGEPELYALSSNSYGSQLIPQTPNTTTTSQVSTSIEFYNNTGSEISACYAYYDNDDKCWISKGWYNIPAYNYKTINIGNYTGNLYIRGTQGLLTEWGSGDGQFCVDATQAFTIKFADTKDCWSKKKFTKYYVKAGVNKWTFN